jgi:hypothetical protein
LLEVNVSVVVVLPVLLAKPKLSSLPENSLTIGVGEPVSLSASAPPEIDAET